MKSIATCSIYPGVTSEHDPLADATYIRANFSYVPRHLQASEVMTNNNTLSVMGLITGFHAMFLLETWRECRYPERIVLQGFWKFMKSRCCRIVSVGNF